MQTSNRRPGLFITNTTRALSGMLLLAGSLSLSSGCGALEQGAIDEANLGNLGQVSLRLEAGQADDAIQGIRYQILDLAGTLLKERFVPMQDGGLPQSVMPNGDQVSRFADAFFVLPPGDYVVRITPMISESEPDPGCQPAQQQVTVTEGQTVEVVLSSSCGSVGNGGLDVVAVVDHAPQITDLQFAPSKFISTGQKLEVKVTAQDADGDALTYKWEIVARPPTYKYWYDSQDDTFFFISTTPGDYQVKVSACEDKPNGACATLTFPIHVQGPATTPGSSCKG